MKGILFKEEMFLAVINGRKTQTRRITKGLALDWLEQGFTPEFISDPENHLARYRTGEVVYLKEPYTIIGEGHNLTILYRYSDTDGVMDRTVGYNGGWQNKLFMPECCARYFIKITHVRCERLQDITEQDAIAEGTGFGWQMNAGWPDYLHIKNGICELTQDTAIMSYGTLWESINGSGSWELNPFVWVYEFELIEEVEK
jgi:hypothetical protein